MNEWECYEKLYGELADHVYFGQIWSEGDEWKNI